MARCRLWGPVAVAAAIALPLLLLAAVPASTAERRGAHESFSHTGARLAPIAAKQDRASDTPAVLPAGLVVRADQHAWAGSAATLPPRKNSSRVAGFGVTAAAVLAS